MDRRLSTWEKRDDVSRWLAPDPMGPDEVVFGRGDGPAMTRSEWQRYSGVLGMSTVETGATTEHAWYRRCTIPDCRVWAGPYPSNLHALTDGLWHAQCAHRVDWYMAPP